MTKCFDTSVTDNVMIIMLSQKLLVARGVASDSLLVARGSGGAYPARYKYLPHSSLGDHFFKFSIYLLVLFFSLSLK